MSSTSPILLFDHPVSSYAQKVRIALRTKSLPFTSQTPVGTGDPSPAFIAANPRLEVPALIHNTTSIFDSTIILEYLEDAFPDPPLLPPPSDPSARAHVRMLEDVADTQYEAINWVWGECLWMERAGPEGSKFREHLKVQTERLTRELYAWLEGKLGGEEFFGGKYGFGVADAALAPIVHRSVYFGFPPEKGGRLEGWLARCRERPAVAETLAEFDEGTKMMFAAREVFQSGRKRREFRDHRLEALVKMGAIEIVEDGLRKGNIKFSWPGAEGVQIG